jgi:tyrosine-protein phosphatase SIW14
MGDFLAPDNFACVENGVYRSSFPRTKNCLFLQKLGLKSVVSLVPEDYPKSMADFYDANGIALISHGLEGNKWPFKGIDLFALNTVLIDILNPENRPLLIHCNKGKHRTGTVVGCLRKYRGWTLSTIYSEYILFAIPKVRCEDQMMIEYFEPDIPLISPVVLDGNGEGDEVKEKKKEKKDKKEKKEKEKKEDKQVSGDVKIEKSIIEEEYTEKE